MEADQPRLSYLATPLVGGLASFFKNYFFIFQ